TSSGTGCSERSGARRSDAPLVLRRRVGWLRIIRRGRRVHDRWRRRVVLRRVVLRRVVLRLLRGDQAADHRSGAKAEDRAGHRTAVVMVVVPFMAAVPTAMLP